MTKFVFIPYKRGEEFMFSYMDYTSPSTQYTFNVIKVLIKDNQNYINVLGIKQLNTLGMCPY
jgi:hypothetical protein